MVTDEERHNVAGQLREEAESWRDLAKGDTLFDMNDAAFIESVMDAFQLVDLDEHVYEALDDMAEVVDRPTTTRHGKFKTKHGSKVPCCEVCGYSIGDTRWNYCPHCGAEVVGDDD